MNLLFLFTYSWIVVRGIHFINFAFLLVSICTWASKHNLLSIAKSEKQVILGGDSLEKKGLKSVRRVITCFSPLPWKEVEAHSDTGISPPTQKHHPQCLCFTLKLRESRARKCSLVLGGYHQTFCHKCGLLYLPRGICLWSRSLK